MTSLPGISISQMVTALENAGFRCTRPRNAIIEQIAEWAAQGQDFTSEELWHAAQQHAPWIGRSTVFRTIELLTTFEFLDKVSFADGSERYHTIQPGVHHHHLTCEVCHRIVAIDACLPTYLFNDLAQESGFVLSGHRLELFGRCAACQDAPRMMPAEDEDDCHEESDV